MDSFQHQFRKNASLFIFLIYLLLTLGLTYPLIFYLDEAVPNDIGDPLLNSWILAWDAHAVLTDPLHLFEANIFYPLPTTLAYSEHMFSTAMLILPIQLISGEPIVAYNLSLFFSFPLAAFGMYLLILHWTSSRSAAFIAGLILAFNPYRFAAIAHLQLLTIQWLPFILLFLSLSLKEKSKISRNIAITLFLSLQLLASWYLAVYTILIVGSYLGGVFVSRQGSRYFWTGGALSGLVAGLIVVPFALPYLTLLSELRQARPLSLALSLAAVPTDFLAAAPFHQIFGPLTENFRSRSAFTEENMLFVGGIAPILALFSALRFRKKMVVIVLGLVLGVSLLLMFPIPYAALATLFPASTVVRVPARWIIPALFALAGLAGWGYRSMTHRQSYHGIFIGIVCLLLIEAWSVPLPLAPVQNQATLNPVYDYLAQRQPADFALLELPLHSAPAPEFPEVKRLYASTVGWWSLVNGYSGYTPPRQPELARRLSGFPDDESLIVLRELAAQKPLFLLIHPGEAPFDRSEWEDQLRWQVERQPNLNPIGQFEGDYLYRVQSFVPERKFIEPKVTFGRERKIHLLGFSENLSTSRPLFDPISPHLILYWQSATPLMDQYTVFIHLRASDGFVLAQADGPPVKGHYPTDQWLPNEFIQDIHPLPDADRREGYHLAIGLYDPLTGERLPALGPSGKRLADDAFIIPLSAE